MTNSARAELARAQTRFEDTVRRILAVPEKLMFVQGDSPTRIVIVFGRSQTEQAVDPPRARERLADLTARKARDGALQVIRETDDRTPDQIGTSVVSREGSPLAAEIVLRLRSDV